MVTMCSRRTGFTLSEVLVSISILCIVMSLVFQLLLGAEDVSRDLHVRSVLQSDAAMMLNRLADDLRTARSISVDGSEDAIHPHIRIVTVNGTETTYLWSTESYAYSRRKGQSTQNMMVSGDFLTDQLKVDNENGLVNIALIASRRVQGTKRVVRIELKTSVQTQQ